MGPQGAPGGPAEKSQTCGWRMDDGRRALKQLRSLLIVARRHAARGGSGRRRHGVVLRGACGGRRGRVRRRRRCGSRPLQTLGNHVLLAWLRPEGNLRSAACQRPPPPLQYPPLFPPSPSPSGRGPRPAPRNSRVIQTASCVFCTSASGCPTRRSCRTGGFTPCHRTGVVLAKTASCVVCTSASGCPTPTDPPL